MTKSRREELRLGDLVSRLESGVSVRADDAPPAAGEVGVLKVSCLTGGRFNAAESKRVPIDCLPRLANSVRKGRVIISRSNTPELVGLCAYVSVDHPNLFLPDTLWQMEFSEERESEPRWLMCVSFEMKNFSELRPTWRRLGCNMWGGIRKPCRGDRPVAPTRGGDREFLVSK